MCLNNLKILLNNSYTILLTKLLLLFGAIIIPQVGFSQNNNEVETKTRIITELLTRESQLAENEDWVALERLYDEYVPKLPNEAWVIANRGFKRLDIGMVNEAIADLRAALLLNPDTDLRRGIDETLSGIKSTRAAGGEVGSSKAASYIYRAVDLFNEGRQSDVAAALSKLDGLQLSSQQKGMVDFINAQFLWANGERNSAFTLYQKAAQVLPKDFFLSEAYAKIAEHYMVNGSMLKAREFIVKALAITPDFVWRRIQAGDIYYADGSYSKAIEYYTQAEQDGSLLLKDRYYYNNLAMAYFHTGDHDRYKTYAQRHIDAEESRLASRPEPTATDRMQLHNIKKAYTYQRKIFNASLYASGSYYDNDDYYSGFTAEFKVNVKPLGIRSEVFARLYGTFASHFSGSYYDLWGGSDRTWESGQHLKETFRAGIGYFAYPFKRFDLKIGLQQNFKIGSSTKTETLLVADLFESKGNDWEPLKSSWLYASIYSVAEYSISYNDIIYRGEGRLGYSFKAGQLFSITPLASLGAGYGGKALEKGSRWGFEGGAGFMLRQWFRSGDRYKTPISSIDLAVQYRFGLSSNRHNAASISLYYSF